MQKARLNKKPSTVQARHYALIALAAMLVMAWQFIRPGYYYKIIEHAAMLPKFITQFKAAMLQGVLYPRWMPEDFNGYGSPTFVFYSPLLFFFSSLLNIAGLSIPLSVSLLNLLALYIGGHFLYLFLKDDFGSRAALIASLFYILLPDRVIDLYVTNTPSGRLGMAWVPMLMYYTRSYIADGFSRKGLFLMALSYALLIVTHIATAYIFTPFAFAYGIWAAGAGRRVKTLPRLALGFASGLCLSAVFLLPAIAEKGFVHIEHFSRSSDYSYWKNFIFSANRHDVADFQKLLDLTRNAIMAEVALLAILVYFAARYSKNAPGRDLWFFIVSLLACLFMMSSASGFLWGHIPGMSTAAFPGRFLPLYIFFFSAISGVAASSLFESRLKPGIGVGVVVPVAAILLIYSAMMLFRSSSPVSGPHAIEYSSSADLIEYLPVQVDTGRLDELKKDRPLVSSTEVCATSIITWDSTDRYFAVDSANGARLTVKTFYFPGWKAWVDGSETAISPEDKTGAIVINVPSGRHAVRLRFMDTPPMAWGKAISLVTLVALVFPYGAVRRRRHINP